jgi:hypothetical protein
MSSWQWNALAVRSESVSHVQVAVTLVNYGIPLKNVCIPCTTVYTSPHRLAED